MQSNRQVEARAEKQNEKERNEIILYRFQNHIIFFLLFQIGEKNRAVCFRVCVCVCMFESMLFPLLHVSFIKFSFCTPSFYPYLGLSLSLSFCRLAIFIFSCYCFSFIRRHDIFRFHSLSLCFPLLLVLAAAAVAARSPFSS